MKAALLAMVAACAARPPAPAPIRARVVPVEPGSYYIEKSFRATDAVEMHAVSLHLAPDGTARLRTDDHFSADADPARDDDESTELSGRWTRTGDGIAIDVRLARSCASGIAEPPCAHAPPAHWPRWRLRCRAMVPERGSALPGAALVCRFVQPEPLPRYGVMLAGEWMLVVGGPRAALRYSSGP